MTTINQSLARVSHVPRVRCGQSVHLRRGKLLGTVSQVHPDRFSVELADGREVWLRANSVAASGVDRVMLVFEAYRLGRYVVEAPAAH
ncbi:MAG: hypothetical protein HUU14_10930 [Dehalococcoidia bacterium]|nr:hypothetical protein [Chloroflexi bacterium CFX7]MCK6563390.1 hypothetical protein [Dehalococcoidia bacterium]NUQ56389.1 hypothetical protein [Dehalococcoidia bacterium]RIL03706.1 MAG: hypothetical protein DCC78_02845 [bacterium]